MHHENGILHVFCIGSACIDQNADTFNWSLGKGQLTILLQSDGEVFLEHDCNILISDTHLNLLNFI